MNRGARLTVALGALVVTLGLVALGPGPSKARGGGAAGAAGCSPGARTLSRPGAVLYPEVGNGGYRSVHTDVELDYQAERDRFLPGTEVRLTLAATQCLSAFSLDFERTAPRGLPGGPHLRVDSVTVVGAPARFRFATPTYPGDPRGPEDPDPRAHQASQHDPVGGPRHNPLPPACGPELTNEAAAPDSEDGTPCPADKLVITPARRIPTGARFEVTVAYHGRPGVHHTGDGSTEGWFRTEGGSGTATEPLGSEDWMPLNDFPSAKPTYDFRVTTERGKTVLAGGHRSGFVRNPPSAGFPDGSATTSWSAPFPIAGYLPFVAVGDYSLSHRTVGGVLYYEAQDRHIGRRRRAHNRAVIGLQPYVTRLEERFNGPYPFPSDGVVASVPGLPGDAEEMETMVSFPGSKGPYGYVDRATLFHETMHQWWGDNVTEAGFEMAFFKEGLATLIEKLVAAEHARRRGGPHAFERKLAAEFDELYGRGPGFWSPAPSATDPYTYLDDDAVYERPSAAYIALRAILGARRFDAALREIQRRYGGAVLREPQLEAAFAKRLPGRNPACQARLRRFFREWFDTAYPTAGGAVKPRITGPGLAGGGFYGAGCRP